MVETLKIEHEAESLRSAGVAQPQALYSLASDVSQCF